MGSQDSFAQAQDFRSDFGIASFDLYWDPGFDSWQHFGVRGQPTAILASPDGTPRNQWSGRFDLDEVLQAAEAL